MADNNIARDDPRRSHSDIIRGFRYIGEFAQSEIKPRIDLNETNHELPCVYAWVERRPDGELCIRYIGQTERGLRRRAPTWFNGDNGKLAASRIADVLSSGSNLSIYVYEPNPIVEFGISVVPQHAVEQLLIKVCTPTPDWNGIASRRARNPNA